MAAMAEAAEVAGASDLETASPGQLEKAWGLVGTTAELTLLELTKAIAEESGVPVADLAGADPRAAALIPGEIAHRWSLLALDCTTHEIRLATSNPLSQEAKREIAALTGRTVLFRLAPPSELRPAIVRAYGPAPAGPVRAVSPLPSQGPHVLVVDDEAGQRALLRSMLEESGYRVTCARDGAAALDQLQRDDSVDLVTLDYWMDRMNGLRALQRIRDTPDTSGIPVIVVTGSDDRRIEMSLFEAGADDYIAKPIDGPLFLLRVQAVLRRRRFA